MGGTFILPIRGAFASDRHAALDWPGRYFVAPYHEFYQVLIQIPPVIISGQQSRTDKLLGYLRSMGGERAKDNLQPYLLDLSSSGVQGGFLELWEVDPAKAQEIAETTGRLGVVVGSMRTVNLGQPLPDMGQVERRIEILEEERRGLERYRERIPGILGLVDAEMWYLRDIRERDSKARSKTLMQFHMGWIPR